MRYFCDIRYLAVFLLSTGCSWGQLSSHTHHGEEALISPLSAANIQDSVAYYHGSRLSLQRAFDLSYSIANYFVHQGMIDSALIFYEESILWATQREDRPRLADAIRIKANLLMAKNRPIDALEYFVRAEKLYRILEDQSMIGHIYLGKSNSYRELGNLDSAGFYAQKAIEIKKQLEEHPELTGAYTLLALIQSNAGNYEAAFKNGYKALENAEKFKDTFQIIHTSKNLSRYLTQYGSLQRAEKLAKQALLLAEHTNLVTTKGQIYEALGRIKAAQGERVDALNYFEAALKLYQIRDKKALIANINLAMAKVKIQEGQYEVAMSYLQTTLKLNETAKYAVGEIDAKNAMAEIFIKTGQSQKAIRLLKATNEFASQSRLSPQLQEIYYLLSKAYAAQQNDQLAFEYYDRYSLLKDSLFNLRQTRIIREMEAKYESEKKEKDILLLNAEAKQRGAKFQQQQFLIYILIFAVLSLIGFAFFFYWGWSKNQIIAAQNEELQQQKINVLQREQELVVLQAMVEGQVLERKRMAAELQDGLGDLLSGTKLQFDQIGKGALSSKHKPAYEKGQQLLDIACQEVRKISYNMMPGAISRFGLVPALTDACKALEKSQNLSVILQTINLDGTFTEHQAINIYRIIQELLNNIAKHADATDVIVQLAKHDSVIHLTVEDNGKGFSSEKLATKEGLGIRSIRTRVDYLNGTLEFNSIPGRATTFYITFPV